VNAFLIDYGACVAMVPVDRNGSFSFGFVPVGWYRIEVRGSGPPTIAEGAGYSSATSARSGPAFWASVDVLVTGETAPPVVELALAGGVRVGGTMVTDAGPWKGTPQGRAAIRPTVTLGGRSAAGAPPLQLSTNVTEDGRFEFPGVPPGRYEVRGLNTPIYGLLVSATSGGRDALDFGLDVSADRDIADLALTFSRLGTVIDGQMAMSGSAAGDPQPRCHAVAFSKDRLHWTPFSRRVVAARPDDLGHFTIRGLPPGGYHISAFDGDEPISWSAAEFLGALKPQAEVTLVRGQTQSAVLTCR
jgi:hypothetical protein